MSWRDRFLLLAERRISRGMIVQRTFNELKLAIIEHSLSTEMRSEEMVSRQETPSSTTSTDGDLVPIPGNFEMFTSVTTTPTTNTRSLMERERFMEQEVQRAITATPQLDWHRRQYLAKGSTSSTPKKAESRRSTKSGSIEMEKLQAEADRISNELLVLSGHVRALVSQMRLWQVRNGVQ